MLAETRKNKICVMLKERQAVTTAELAEKFEVSIETVRKDLLELERKNELVRVHGGAMLRPSARNYRTFSKRREDMIEEKVKISEKAAEFIKEGDIIAIDTGSTAFEFIDVLKERFERLTIVTHSMYIFQKASEYKDFEIILCAGFYMRAENSFYGEFALNMLDNIRVEKSFVFPNSISLNYGLSESLPELAAMQKKLMNIAEQVIVVADSSKYETNSFIKTSDLNPKYIYITDSGLQCEVKQMYENNGIKIVKG